MNRVSNEEVQNRIKENNAFSYNLEEDGHVTKSEGMLTTLLEGKYKGTNKVTNRLRITLRKKIIKD